VVGVAAVRPDPTPAARLCGAAEAVHAAMGGAPTPHQREYLDQTMAAAPAPGGAEAVAAAPAGRRHLDRAGGTHRGGRLLSAREHRAHGTPLTTGWPCPVGHGSRRHCQAVGCLPRQPSKANRRLPSS
jgi:hypothetical protein